MDALINEILEDLRIELSADEEGGEFSETLLLSKIKNATREVKTKRRYPVSYTDEMISRDLTRYYSTIRSVALYDYNSIGNEGEESHSEKNISRTYVDRNSLFYGVNPIARKR